MKMIGKAMRVRARVGNVLIARERVRVMSSILFLGCACLFFMTSWQEPSLVHIVQNLFAKRTLHPLRDGHIHGWFGPSKDWHNLLVPRSSNYTFTLVNTLEANRTSASRCFLDTTNFTTLEGLPQPVNGKYILHTDEVHYLTLVAHGSHGKRCAGGDYFEVDFHDRGDLHFRSRLPTVDFGNGSYDLELKVPSRFAGTFSLEIWLLFSNWHGMDFHPEPFVKQSLMVAQELEMVVRSKGHQFFEWSLLDTITTMPDLKVKKLPQTSLKQCTLDDFNRTTWQGRWTRAWSNPDCEADREKRFHCLPDEHYQCEEPWCFGPVGRLESNGWAYSAHCSFKIFESEEAWDCLSGKWFFMWGDSNFQDTIRNLLLFVLDWNLPPGQTLADFQLARSYETTFANPKRASQVLQVSQLFNGAYPDSGDGEGLITLQNEEYQERVLSHFRGDRTPDTIFMNSGLHDGVHFATVEAYIDSVDFAIDWWIKLYSSLPADRKPLLIYRTTIAPAGVARKMQANPTKMEMYNQVMVEKLKQAADLLPVKFMDGFDMTFPFHYNNDYSDGGHYGRAPGANLAPWYRSPHWYFVDVMLAHIFLNAVCPATLLSAS